jgi:drug/metabolite transporter (DMT)-like permease
VVYYVGKLFGLLPKPVEETFLSPSEKAVTNRQFWFDGLKWGTIVGLFVLGLTIGIQYGELSESAGKTSFVVGMYVVVIPICEMFLSGFAFSLPLRTWIAIAIVIPGIFIISGCTQTNCFAGGFQWGVLFNFLAMLCVAGHALATARAMPVIGASYLLLFEWAFCVFWSLLFALIFEAEYWVYPFTEIRANFGLIMLTSAGEFISVICITVALGIISTTRAGVVMSIESLSGAICGYIFLGEVKSLYFKYFTFYP